jgi:hypothetical protein
MELNVDGRQYAIDHTLIDSYENRSFDDVRLSRVLEPVIRELNAARALPMEGTFAFLVEAGALTAVKDRDIPVVQRHVRSWIVGTAPSLRAPANPALAAIHDCAGER